MGEDAGGRRRGWFAAGLAALVAAAAATRFYGLASWPLFGDELYTLQDSADFSFSFLQRPLVFWLNHHLVQPFLPLDALGLRLLPALFGVAGVAALAEMGRRMVGARAGLLAGLLAVFSPWHLEMSQLARYYSLVFLLSALSPAALYLGVRERSRGWTAAGIAVAVLAWFAHPTAILPAAGFLLWLAGWAVVRSEGRKRRWLLAAVAAAAVAGLAAGWALLTQWTSLGQEWGIGGLWVGVSYSVRLTAGPALAAIAGVALLWADGRRELAAFLAAAGAVPVVVIAVLGTRVPVHTGYLFAAAPYALLAAGAFLDGTFDAVRGAARASVVGAAALGVVLATGVPSFVSHYVDGGRGDFRRAARHVAARAGPGDLVLVEHTGPFEYYTPSLEARPLVEDTVRLDSIRQALGRSSPAAELWIVPYVHSQGGFGLDGLGPARGWVWRRCRLSARIDPVRIDHQRNIVEVWRCGDATPRGPSGDGAGPGPEASRPDPGTGPAERGAGDLDRAGARAGEGNGERPGGPTRTRSRP